MGQDFVAMQIGTWHTGHMNCGSGDEDAAICGGEENSGDVDALSAALTIIIGDGDWEFVCCGEISPMGNSVMDTVRYPK